MKTLSMSLRGVCLLVFALVIPVLLSAKHARGYEITNLVSNIPGNASNTDPNLLNPWGLVIEDGHLYVANNHSDSATSYKTDGDIRDFFISVAGGPTGIVYNHFKDAFKITKHHEKERAKFLFATEEGKILGYNKKVDPLAAIVVVEREDTVYKGLAIGECGDTEFLYAADFHNGKVDVFDFQFNWIMSITDPSIPAGFAPFNVRVIDDLLYVTFAKQSPPDNEDDEPGPGNGYVDVFTLTGGLVGRLISNDELNSPWGIAIAPHHFGKFSKALLIGNFGDGRINAYNRHTGEFLGQLEDFAGNPIVIPGLWALDFKHHSLFFTAGPNDETDGLVGVIHAKKNSH